VTQRAHSHLYTIYDKDGKLVTFGVTDVELKRLDNVLKYEVTPESNYKLIDKIVLKFEHILSGNI